MRPTVPQRPAPSWSSRGFWLRQMRQWHWISAAISLIGMLAFVITGITLNHSAQIEAKPAVTMATARLPADLLAAVKADAAARKGPLPAAMAEWTRSALSADTAGKDAEWSADEIYVSLPRPGGDAWLSIDMETGEVRYEQTSRGWISYLNDLHKGRNTGAMWSLFIDVFSIACVVFCVTGLILMQLMSAQRPSTWPLVAAGFLIPALLAILFIH